MLHLWYIMKQTIMMNFAEKKIVGTTFIYQSTRIGSDNMSINIGWNFMKVKLIKDTIFTRAKI